MIKSQILKNYIIIYIMLLKIQITQYQSVFYSFIIFGYNQSIYNQKDVIVKQSLSVDIIAGPPNNNYNPISPFVWSESDFKNENHIGQPDKWDFNWYRIDHNGNMNELN